MDLKVYRKKVILRTVKRCLITALILLLPGLIMGIVNRWLFLFCLLDVLPVIYLVSRLRILCSYSLSSGRIDDVILFDDKDQPLCDVHVVYSTDSGEKRELTAVAEHYGDYEDGIEPELEKMRERIYEKFAGRSVPVFYEPDRSDRDFIYLEDSFSKDGGS